MECEELMFGGAVGGGKTEVALHWLAEGVQYPEYSGLFLRRTFSQLAGSPSTPIERSYKFFKPLGGVFNAGKHVWTFPSRAMIRFGHMQHENDKHNYDGPEFHKINFDQVEQFSETQYTYMFSRLRRTAGFPVQCGIRSNANPVGGSWVKRRFVSDEAIETLRGYTAYDRSPPGMCFDSPCGAKFMPSRIADNPSLEVEEYIERLRSKLGAVLAARLANGDWSVVENAIIDPDDLRRFQMRGEMLICLDASGMPFSHPIDARMCQRFATIDTAGTAKQKADEARGKPASWSTCAIWDYHAPLNFLFLRHVWRDRVGWKGLCSGIRRVLADWNVPRAKIENAHHGPALAEELQGGSRTTVELVNTVIPGMEHARGAKLERATASTLLQRIAKSELFLPDSSNVAGVSSWLPEYETELITWTGLPDETADQVDVTSYAADHVRNRNVAWGGVLH